MPCPSRKPCRAASIRRRNRGSFTRRYSNQSSSEPKPISTPAGLPCRVITISSVSARRRYFERSSFTSESGTVFIALTYLFEPRIRIGFRDDRETLNLLALDVIEYPKVIDPQPI